MDDSTPTGTSSATHELVDVRDMVAAHQAMRREFRLSAAAVRRTADGDRRQAGRVAHHLRCLTTVLEHHHDGGDRLLWPKLHARVPGELGATVPAMERQHEAIHALLGTVESQTTDWARNPGAAARSQLADSLLRLSDALDADPACLAVLWDRAPAPVRLFAPAFGPRSCARRARRVHGTAAP